MQKVVVAAVVIKPEIVAGWDWPRRMLPLLVLRLDFDIFAEKKNKIYISQYII